MEAWVKSDVNWFEVEKRERKRKLFWRQTKKIQREKKKKKMTNEMHCQFD